MRMNIDLDPALVAEAFTYTELRTTTDLVHLALREFIRERRRFDLRDLRGQIAFEAWYDHKRLRD